jgi:hypothetical protein
VPIAVILLLSLPLPFVFDAGPSGAWRFNPGLSETAPLDTVDPRIRPWVEPVHDLVIRLTEEEVVFYVADGLRRVYKLGKRTRDLAFHDVETTARVDWDGVTLRIERKVGADCQVTQIYAVDQQERRLTVTIVVSVRGGGHVTRIRHVYDSAR